MRYLALSLTIFLVNPVFADQGPQSNTDVPVELKGIKLESTLESAKTQFPTLECIDANVAGVVICRTKQESFAEARAKLTMTFIDGKLYHYSFTEIPISKYQLVFDSLSAKYGKPSRNHKADNGLVRELGPGNYVKGLDFWRDQNKDVLIFEFDPHKMFPNKFGVVVEAIKYSELMAPRRSPSGQPKEVTTDI